MSRRVDDNNLNLIWEVQKYESLYNHHLPEYSNQEIIDHAWEKISLQLNMTVTECKEKWRNIRSAYVRSLKGSKSNRPYYLHTHLKFILPYIKLFRDTICVSDSLTDKNDDVEGTSIGTVFDGKIKTERRSKRSISEDESEISRFADYILQKRNKNFNEESKTHSPIQHFFMSLIPDVETMSQDQLRRFKIEVMLLIDKLKQDPEKS